MMSLSMAAGLDQVILNGPFQHKAFCYSVASCKKSSKMRGKDEKKQFAYKGEGKKQTGSVYVKGEKKVFGTNYTGLSGGEGRKAGAARDTIALMPQPPGKLVACTTLLH